MGGSSSWISVTFPWVYYSWAQAQLTSMGRSFGGGQSWFSKTQPRSHSLALLSSDMDSAWKRRKMARRTRCSPWNCSRRCFPDFPEWLQLSQAGSGGDLLIFIGNWPIRVMGVEHWSHHWRLDCWGKKINLKNYLPDLTNQIKTHNRSWLDSLFEEWNFTP